MSAQFICGSIILTLATVVSANSNQTPVSSLQGLRRQITLGYFSSLAALTPLILLANSKDKEREGSLRRELFAQIPAGSSVLEVGFGAGLGANLEYYPCDTGLTLTGLDPYLDSDALEDGGRRRRAYAAKGIDFAQGVAGYVERLPFQAQSFDVVASSLVLCSVDDASQALTEISRVLRKGGLYLSVEHVLAEEEPLASSQRLLDPLQQIVADGCHLTRRTDRLLQSQQAESSLVIRSMIKTTFGSQWPISSQIYTTCTKV